MSNLIGDERLMPVAYYYKYNVSKGMSSTFEIFSTNI